MHKFELNGQVAVVTGGGRGLGEAIALAIARSGANVAVVSRTRSQIEETACEIKALGQSALAVVADVAKLEDVQLMVNKVAQRFGRIDVLVNAAGVNQRAPSLDVSPELWERILSINLRGTFFCCQAAATYMIQQNGGAIVNIASITSSVGIPSLAPYAASKAGVEALTRVLAAEWAPHGVRVNAVAPGYFRTEMTKSLFEDVDWVDRLLARIPLGRAGLPEDLAEAVVFLVSPAARYVTGQVVTVDGGFLGTWRDRP